MHAKTTLSALVLAAGFAGQVAAETPTIVDETFTSTRTRAEVLAELADFRAARVNPWADDYDALAGFRSTASAQAVRADFLASRGQVRALHGEDSGSMYLAQRHGPAAAADTVIAGTAR